MLDPQLTRNHPAASVNATWLAAAKSLRELQRNGIIGGKEHGGSRRILRCTDTAQEEGRSGKTAQGSSEPGGSRILGITVKRRCFGEDLHKTLLLGETSPQCWKHCTGAIHAASREE